MPAMTEPPVEDDARAGALPGLAQTLSEAPPLKGSVGLMAKIAPWVDISAKIATVAVLGLAVGQYYKAGQDAKRERSLQLVAEWVEDGQPERIAAINSFLLNAAAAARPQVAALPETMRDKAWANANESILESLVARDNPQAATTRSDIDRLFGFFVRVDICVSSGLCDADVARDYFLVEAQSLTTELAPLVAKLRQAGQPGYGRAAEAFVSRVSSE